MDNVSPVKRWRETNKALFPKAPFLDPTDKAKRLDLMKRRYHKPRCRYCSEKAYYNWMGKLFCRNHLPEEGRHRLSAEYQWRMLWSMLRLLDA